MINIPRLKSKFCVDGPQPIPKCSLRMDQQAAKGGQISVTNSSGVLIKIHFTPVNGKGGLKFNIIQ